MMRTVELRAISPGRLANMLRELHIGPLFVPNGDDLVLHSPVAFDGNVNAQLNWIYDHLRLHRKKVRQLQEQDGLRLMIRIVGDGRPFRIEPRSVMLAHTFGIPMEIVTRRARKSRQRL